VALALRMLCGLSTTEVAKAFLVKESAMAARLTRAKKKIALARIRTGSLYGPNFGAVPTPFSWSFTSSLRPVTRHQSVENLSEANLVERALDLARMLHGLLPRTPKRRACWP